MWQVPLLLYGAVFILLSGHVVVHLYHWFGYLGILEMDGEEKERHVECVLVYLDIIRDLELVLAGADCICAVGG